MRSSDVADGIDLAGRRVVVTGASSGLGVETARMLAAIGAEATIAVRNTEADRQVEAVIAAAACTDRLRVAHLDLAERASMARFADESDGQLDMLVNNAGGASSRLPARRRRARLRTVQDRQRHVRRRRDRPLDDITVNAAMPGPAHTTSQRKMDPERLCSRLGGKQLGEDEVPPRDGRRPRDPGRMLTPAR